MTLTPEEQATAAVASSIAAEAPAQDPAVASAPPAQPAPAAVPAAPVSQGPWSADLEQRFADPGVRQSVDAFLRETVQPYTTKLEQDLAPAKSLWEDFHSKPRETFLEIATDIYGEDGAKAIAETLDAQATPGNDPYEQVVEQAQQVQPSEDPLAALPPEVRDIVQERREAEDRAAFRQDFEATAAKHPDLNLDFDLLVPHVAITGDWETAIESFQQYEAKVAARNGGTPPEPGTTTEPPPPVVGIGASGPTTPPQAKQYGADLHGAIDDFFNDERSKGSPANLSPTGP